MTEPNGRASSVVDRMLASMTEWNASDLFLCEGRQAAVRIHGRVVPLEGPETKPDEMREFLDSLLSKANRDRFEHIGDLDVGYSLPDGRRFRFALAKQRGQVSIVVRALPSGEKKFDDLGLPEAMNDLADLSRGLVLVAGATGSGKSTTLAALIHRINAVRRAHIVTIEDPIEFVHTDLKSRVTQREVGEDTMSFHNALRHVVRQSPDVILIGEMRDSESMQVALAAALTGHLVVSTLHTIDTTQTLQRILSYFPEHLRGQVALDLSLALKGVVAQRLVPRADGKGRVLAVEMLTMTPAASRLIREQRIDDLQDLMRGSTEPGVITFNQSLLHLYREEKISYEVGIGYATNPDEFALSAKGMATGVAGFRGDAGGGTSAGLDMQALLGMVLERGASDLHVTVGRPPIFRVAGSLRPLDVPPLTVADMRLLLNSLLSARQRTTYDLERELDFALQLESGERFRVNAYFQKGHPAASLRAIPTSIPTPEELRVPPQVLRFAERPHGLVLVVGPTGSGKTTTLACLIDRINKSRACRIITVEDPIEYTHQSQKATVDQRELYEDTLTFSKALKYVLRQDPDVILVGELRDLETISSAMTAAETGHLVLATLHTNDAGQSIDRIIDVFPAHQQPQVRAQLASALVGVVSQRLLPRKDGRGRVPAFEVLIANTAVRTLIREGNMHQATGIMETAKLEGMQTIDAALKDLLYGGFISYDVAMQFARNPRLIDPNYGKAPSMAAGPANFAPPPVTPAAYPQQSPPPGGMPPR